MKPIAAILLALCASALAQQTDELITLKAAPSAVPNLPLKHRLVVEVVDKTPGNAATIYMTAGNRLSAARATDKTDDDAIDRLLKWPAADFNREEAGRILDKHREALDLLAIAANRETADWGWPLREQGFATLLPHLSEARGLCRVLALRVRLNLADGKFDAAAQDLRTGMAYVRHLNSQPLLIQCLVAVAIQNLMLEQVQHWIATPNSPNLYWPLAEILPAAADLRQAMQYERAALYWSVPALKDIRTGKFTLDSWKQAVGQMARFGSTLHDYSAGAKVEAEVGAALLAVKDYAAAKRYLAEQEKLTPEQVEAMPVPEAIARFHVGTYEKMCQETDKWYALPYHQGREGLAATEKAMLDGGSSGPNILVRLIMPAVSRAYAAAAAADRKSAALRTVEALRAHAAANKGQAPARLDDIKILPVPLDPMTGKPFDYAVDGRKCILSAPSAGWRGALRIELELSESR